LPPLKTTDVLVCTWCKRSDHHESSCWRKLNLCLICGGGHKMNSCPKFIPSVTANHRPVCSVCHGEHLGKHCARMKLRGSYCN
jgi:hypothetical protein